MKAYVLEELQFSDEGLFIIAISLDKQKALSLREEYVKNMNVEPKSLSTDTGVLPCWYDEKTDTFIYVEEYPLDKIIIEGYNA
jgi:hypothetical protein